MSNPVTLALIPVKNSSDALKRAMLITEFANKNLSELIFNYRHSLPSIIDDITDSEYLSTVYPKLDALWAEHACCVKFILYTRKDLHCLAICGSALPELLLEKKPLSIDTSAMTVVHFADIFEMDHSINTWDRIPALKAVADKYLSFTNLHLTGSERRDRISVEVSKLLEIDRYTTGLPMLHAKPFTMNPITDDVKDCARIKAAIKKARTAALLIK